MSVSSEPNGSVFATIQAAIDAAEPGGTIVVPAGTYAENVTLNKSEVTLRAEPGATIAGTVTVSGQGARLEGFELTKPDSATTEDGISFSGWTGRSLLVTAESAEIVGNTINVFGAQGGNPLGFVEIAADGVHFQGNTVQAGNGYLALDDNRGTAGVRVSGGDGVVLESNTILVSTDQADAIAIAGGTVGLVTVDGNTITGDLDGGLVAFGSYGTLSITNNVISDYKGVGIRLFDSSQDPSVTVTGNIVGGDTPFAAQLNLRLTDGLMPAQSLSNDPGVINALMKANAFDGQFGVNANGQVQLFANQADAATEAESDSANSVLFDFIVDTGPKRPGDGSVWQTGTGNAWPNEAAFLALKADGSVMAWGSVGNGADLSGVEAALGTEVAKVYSTVSAFAALMKNGTVIAWGSRTSGGDSASVPELVDVDTANVDTIASTRSAFAAIRNNGSVVTWGNPVNGGDSEIVASQLFSVKQVFSTSAGFAALRTDGTVVVWGAPLAGGSLIGATVKDIIDGEAVSRPLIDEDLTNVRSIASTENAFAALKEDGSVIAWGSPLRGGDMPFDVAAQLSQGAQLGIGVTQIYSNGAAFAVLRDDGSVVTWRTAMSDDAAAVADALAGGVVSIYATGSAFAALKQDGSVVTWGDSSRGGNSSLVSESLSSGVVTIFSTENAFAALKEDGSVVTWGDPRAGGNSDAVADLLSGGIVTIFSTSGAFAALTVDGSVVTWGDAAKGGNSTAVSADLRDGVVAVYATSGAFAALKEDGSVIAWGDRFKGGVTEEISDALADQVLSIASPFASPPTIDPVTDDDIINALEKESGVDISGTASPGETVRVSLGGAEKTVLADTLTGVFTASFAASEIPADGNYVVVARASLNEGLHNHGIPGVRPVLIDTTPPPAPVINIVSDDDAINAAERAEGIVIDGTAEAGSTVTVTLGQVERSATAGQDGAFSVTFADNELPEQEGPITIIAQATDTASNTGEPAERTILIDTTPPPAPVINVVSDDDAINAAERAEGIVIDGTAEAGSTVTVTLAQVERSATAGQDGAFSVTFADNELPESGPFTVTAIATDAAGNVSATGERAVEFLGAEAAGTVSVIVRDRNGAPMEGVTISTADEAIANTLSLTLSGTSETTRAELLGNLETDVSAIQFTIAGIGPDSVFQPGSFFDTWIVVVNAETPAQVEFAGILPPDETIQAAEQTILLGTIEDNGNLQDPLANLSVSNIKINNAVVSDVRLGGDQKVTDADGSVTLDLAVGADHKIDASRDYDQISDGKITAQDALEIMRLAVGLAPSWGPAAPLDFIAADIDQDGAVTALDALEVLRFAVGSHSASQPRWVFLDSEADLSAIDRTNAAVDTGIRIDALTAGLTDVSMTGVLLGNMQEYGGV
ncbi:MAG: Ig-like domain-containing protein [Pararhodobacter sp.]